MSVIPSTLAVIAAAIWIPGSPLGTFFDFVALPVIYWKWMILIVTAYIVTTQNVKDIYIKINKQWL
ncbi:hypothetical protein [Desemzia sp. FAM 23991]|uniref:hypothetical protein n=1 Tax=unclassified Desemzia TaxID=2685243 RepID=UPI003886FFB8